MKLWRSVLKALDGWTTWGSSGVADEAEAFLQGRLLERMLSCGAGGQAPGWMWLNAVAHGDPEQVEMLATVCADKAKPTGGWRGARARLARELLDRSEGDVAAMLLLQQQVLIPLEEKLAEVTDLTAARLTDIGVHELRFAAA
jgi:hypothetical protein